MKPVLIFSLVLIASLFLTKMVAAYSAPTSTFEYYVGTTQWRVDVTEDDTACGASAPTTHSYAIYIQHNLTIADVGSWGHGSMRGSFTGNTLNIPGKVVSDPPGSSRLSDIKLVFTSDCSSFSGSYTWYYSDSYGSCSGSTTLRGTSIDSTGCPAQTPQEKSITAIRAETDDAQKQEDYESILANDPNNFWANWDMAELKKKEGSYTDYLRYFNGAMSNENILSDTKDKMKSEVAKKLHLSQFPTANTCPLLRVETDEESSWNGGLIYDVNVLKEAVPDKGIRSIYLWGIFGPNNDDIVTRIVGPPSG